MSVLIFPTLAGQGWSITRTPMWQTRKPIAISGKETAIADWTYPKYMWTVLFSVLRQGSGFYTPGDSFTEMATLMGFYNARQGGFDSFLYLDQDDNTAAAQVLGTGDGVTTSFQLVRAFGGFAEPILAPNVVTDVKDNGTPVSGANYTVNLWGTIVAAGPGTITFNTAPAVGHTLTADFTFYWPCRFSEDKCDFEKMMAGRYSVKKMTFTSVK